MLFPNSCTSKPAGSIFCLLFFSSCVIAGQPNTELEPKVLARFDKPLHSLALAPNGKKIASLNRDGVLKVYETHTFKELEVSFKEMPLLAVCRFSPNGKMILGGGQDGELLGWDANSGERVLKIQAHGGPVTSIDISDDNKTILSGSRDKTVRMFNAYSKGETLKLYEGNEWIQSVALSSDLRYAAFADIGCNLKIWDLRGNKAIVERKHFGLVSFSPKASILSAGSPYYGIQHFDLKKAGEVEVPRMFGRSYMPFCIRHSSSGSWVATGGGVTENLIIIWRSDCARELVSLSGHSDSVLALVISPDDRELISAGKDGCVLLWEISKLDLEKLVKDSPPPPSSSGGGFPGGKQEETKKTDSPDAPKP